jgi:hypothetical protein
MQAEVKGALLAQKMQGQLWAQDVDIMQIPANRFELSSTSGIAF